jgi:hypothetical protein
MADTKTIEERVIVGKTEDGRPIFKGLPISGGAPGLSLSNKVNIAYACGNCHAHNERKKVECEPRYIFNCGECNSLNQLDVAWKSYSLAD